MTTIAIEKTAVGYCRACRRELVCFEPMDEPYDCNRCGTWLAAFPVTPYREAWFSWAETPEAGRPIRRHDFAGPFASREAAEAARGTR